MTGDPIRLPRDVEPRRYDLTIVPDLQAARFAGEVTIELDVRTPVAEVVLHALDLEVELGVLRQSGRDLPATLATDTAAERVRVSSSELAPGPASLTLRFNGELSDNLVGFYRSTYIDDADTTRTLATTQFEAPHARRAFPCFDEPEFKAVFSITLVVDHGLVAISNGPEIARSPDDDGRVRIRFGETIPMSTYLVAFVVGPLEVSAPVDVDGTPLRIVTAPGRGHLGSFATEVGAFALRFFTEYYGIPYPGAKLDLVALPDFAFGAMENLGCVTFRESALLVDQADVTQTEAAQVALTIVHEIAHMWFGDLVTMKWWNGIWLNEAFATFMQYAGVDALRPEWCTWDDFALQRAAALDVDALSNTRAVEYEVHTPEDADAMFDVLTYLKGGSVVRMLERWLGASSFRDGVRYYLDRYKFANTETTDLWDALEHATERPARRIMDSWIFQSGYPELTVEPVEGALRITQQRFRYDRAIAGERWSVPMLVRDTSDAGTESNAVLLDAESITIPNADGALMVLNAGGEGFYRVAYPPAWPARLVATGVLSPRERFVLVDDAWAGVLTGTMPATEFLEFAMSFRDESDVIVWRALLGRLRGITRLVDGAALAALRTRLGALVEPHFARFGWDPSPVDGPRERQLRGLLLDALGTVAHDRETIARADEYRDRPNTDADVVAACITVTACHGGTDLFDEYATRFRDAETPQDQLRYLYALTMFPDADLVLRATTMALTDAVRTQNAPFVLQRALVHREHGPLVWEYISDNWEAVEERFPRMLIARMFEGVTWLVDDASVQSVAELVARHPVPEGAQIIAQHLERQRTNHALVAREADALAAHLTAT